MKKSIANYICYKESTIKKKSKIVELFLFLVFNKN